MFADGTSNPWGCDYDAAGNFFVSACVIDHFFHMAPGGIYVRQGGAPENPYAYELLPSIVKHKHFRAAYAGIQIYQGGRYPADTHGHAFIGNIHDNAIHEEVVTPVGAGGGGFEGVCGARGDGSVGGACERVEPGVCVLAWDWVGVGGGQASGLPHGWGF